MSQLASKHPSYSTLSQTKASKTLFTLGMAMVFFQRFGFDLGAGQVQLTSIILAIIIAYVVRVQGPSKSGTILLCGLIGVATITTLASAQSGWGEISIPSLGLFIITYSAVLAVPSKNKRVVDSSSLVQGMMVAVTVGAALAVLQSVFQTIGLGYWDPFREGDNPLLLSGYNSYYDLEFSGGIKGEYKPNGIIFLEPSFLSMYCGIGVCWAAGNIFLNQAKSSLTWDLLRLALCLAGLAVSASTSGLVIIGAAGMFILYRAQQNRLVIPLLGVVILICYYLGLFESVIAKLSEGITGNTSTALRLTMPYEVLLPYWIEKPVLGWGPGLSTQIIQQLNVPGLQASTIMKLLVEYGAFGAATTFAIVGMALAKSKAPRYFIIAVMAAWIVPAEALLNASIVLLLVVALPNWRPDLDLDSRNARGWATPHS